MFKKGNHIRSETGNVYVVTQVTPPQMYADSLENRYTLAQQISAEDRPLTPDECGLFDMLEGDLEGWKVIA